MLIQFDDTFDDNSHPFKKYQWNYTSLLSFIEWYKNFINYVLNNRTYAIVRKQKVKEQFLPFEHWFNADYTRYLCSHENFDILNFTYEMLFENVDETINSDYIMLNEETQIRNDLCIFMDSVYNTKMLNLYYDDIVNILFKDNEKFGVIFQGSHFYPIDIPNDRNVINNLITDLAKKIINDYCINNNENQNIYSDIMINEVKKFNTTLPKLNEYKKKNRKYEQEIKSLKEKIKDLRIKLKKKK
jgi:hypothetical protein